MYRYVLRRILMTIPILFGVIFIVFAMMTLLPNDPGRLILGIEAHQEAVDMFNAEFGLDQPFLTQFGRYITGIVTELDFGVSFRTRQPVVDELSARFGITFRLALFSIITTVVMGIPLGVLAAVKRSTIADSTVTVYAMFLTAIPAFWLGLILIYIFTLQLGLLPSFGNQTWRHFIMPVIAMSLPASGGFMRTTRVVMLETVNQEYIKTARAKGAPEYIVIWKHAFKNACLPIVNAMGLTFSALLGGSVVIEVIFSINGLGNYILTAIRAQDIPIVMGGVVLLSALFCIIVLAIDLLYALLDPRIRAKFSSS